MSDLLSTRSRDVLLGSIARILDVSLENGDDGRHSSECMFLHSSRCKLMSKRLRIVVVIAHTKLLYRFRDDTLRSDKLLTKLQEVCTRASAEQRW